MIKDCVDHCVVYALTSDGNDVFADMTRVSVASLRIYNPDVKIVLACDHLTVAALCGAITHKLFSEVDEVVRVSTPAGSPTFRNRFVKTSLREAISGPFLYLDADTLIRADLKDIFTGTGAVRGAPNHSGSGDPDDMPMDEREPFVMMGWALPTQYYINGGVLFLSDDDDGYRFSELWHRKWLSVVAATGKFRDQPALNSALADSRASFSWLPHRFNAQVDVRPARVQDAAIWHLYSGNGPIALRTAFDEYVLAVNKTGEISAEIICRLCTSPHPWKVHNVIDYLCVRSIVKRENFLQPNSFERLWLSGNRSAGGRQLAHRVIRNLHSALRRGYRGLRSIIEPTVQK